MSPIGKGEGGGAKPRTGSEHNVTAMPKAQTGITPSRSTGSRRGLPGARRTDRAGALGREGGTHRFAGRSSGSGLPTGRTFPSRRRRSLRPSNQTISRQWRSAQHKDPESSGGVNRANSQIPAHSRSKPVSRCGPRSSPITAARPRWYFTTLPFSPRKHRPETHHESNQHSTEHLKPNGT